jgi:hypothetical protein
MDSVRREQWAAASGFAAIAFGAAAAALERSWPTTDPVAFSAFVAENRGAMLAQSMLFAIGAGAYVWFLGSLRSFLMRAEGGTGRLSTVAFGAGIIWAGTAAVLLLSFAVVAASGPLAPQGWLTLALYPASAIWLIPATGLMIRRMATAQVSTRSVADAQEAALCTSSTASTTRERYV